MGINEKELYVIDYVVGTLKVYDDRCIVSSKKNFLNFLVGKFAQGEKVFYYSDITSIQFKEPDMLSDGFIEFETAGSHGKGSGSGYVSENRFAFGKKQLTEMLEVRKLVEEKVKNNKAGVPTSSTADELQKFKKLLDDGIITQEEFDAKKNQLLGL